MTAPFSFSLLAVLLAITRRGFSIECQTCYALNTECTGSVKVCDPKHDACRSIVIETNTSTKTQKAINKGCAIRSQCTPGAIFMDLEKGYQESGNSICCTTDRCNTADLTVPTRNETLNGLRCPFCYAQRPETCKEEIINCRGWENQCFTRGAGGKTVTAINSVTTVSYEITQKGCATESFCANVAGTASIISGSYVIFGAQEIKCRAAAREARPADSQEQNTPNSGTSITLDSTQLCLQAFAGLLLTTSFYHGLF